MRILFAGLLILAFNCAYSQYVSSDTIGRKAAFENIYSLKLSGDSLCTGYCIVIKKEVKAHKHATHSEHVVVLEGQGKMYLGEKSFLIKKGDVVFIPKNTAHSVISIGKNGPLKVISVQAPLFDGTDRIMIEQKQ